MKPALKTKPPAPVPPPPPAKAPAKSPGKAPAKEVEFEEYETPAHLFSIIIGAPETKTAPKASAPPEDEPIEKKTVPSKKKK